MICCFRKKKVRQRYVIGLQGKDCIPWLQSLKPSDHHISNEIWMNWNRSNSNFIQVDPLYFICFCPFQTLQPMIFWLVVWNMTFIFSYIAGRIIPIDFHMVQRGRYTTNQVTIVTMGQYPLIHIDSIDLLASFFWKTLD